MPGEVRLNIKKIFLMERVVKYWNELSRLVVKLPLFKRHETKECDLVMDLTSSC